VIISKAYYNEGVSALQQQSIPVSAFKSASLSALLAALVSCITLSAERINTF